MIRRALAVAVALSFLLAGCSGGDPTDSAVSFSERVEDTYTPPPPAQTQASPPTENGLIPKVIGQQGGLVDVATDEPWMQFTLDAITANPGCPGPGSRAPSLGQFVVLSLTIMMIAPPPPGGGFFFVSSGDFHIIGPNGVRDNTNETLEAFSCLDESERLPGEPLTVGTYVGSIVLDTPHLGGQVVWSPPQLPGGGWVWEF